RLPVRRPSFDGPLTERQLVALDCLLAVGYVVPLLALWHTDPAPPDLRGGAPAAVADLLVLASGLPLAARRRWPLPVFAVVCAAALGQVALWAVREPFLALALAAYPVGVTRATGPWLRVTGAGLLAVSGLVGRQPDVAAEEWWA